MFAEKRLRDPQFSPPPATAAVKSVAKAQRFLDVGPDGARLLLANIRSISAAWLSPRIAAVRSQSPHFVDRDGSQHPLSPHKSQYPCFATLRLCW